jgi:hypothetical protein
VKLERLVLECLEKDPNLRPESAQALLDRLDACDDVAPWGAEEARRWWLARRTGAPGYSPAAPAFADRGQET